MLPEDQEVEVVPVDEVEHVYRVRARGSGLSVTAETIKDEPSNTEIVSNGESARSEVMTSE